MENAIGVAKRMTKTTKTSPPFLKTLIGSGNAGG